MNKITVLGLGAGDFNQLPMGVYRKLQSVSKLYVRTMDHPVLNELQRENFEMISFDGVYEKHDTFLPVYEEITETLISAAKKEDVIYAVPGHPLVAEMTIQLLIQAEKEGRIALSIEGGQSFLDAIFGALKIDPIDGFQLVDGSTFSIDHINMNNHLLIAQVYDQMSASNVKLTLMEKYDDAYEVTIVTAAGSSEEVLQTVPLFELDHVATINNLTTVYVPPVANKYDALKEWSTLRDIMKTLRGPEGCDWDKAQTHETLKRYLLEEVHEVLQAIDEKDDDHIVEEFGDLLMLVFMNAQIGEEEGYFNLEDMLEAISKKMLRRHPHVFGDVSVSSVEEINANWEAIKRQERAEKPKDASILDGEYRAESALQTSYNYQKAAAKQGFEWPQTEGFWTKFEEELAEWKESLANGSRAEQLDELGDVLITIVNLARHYKLSADEAMMHGNEKFKRRFNNMELQAKNGGRDFSQYTLEEMLEFWKNAKAHEGGN